MSACTAPNMSAKIVSSGKPLRLPSAIRIEPAHTSRPKPSAARMAIIVTTSTAVSRRFAASRARKSLAAVMVGQSVAGLRAASLLYAGCAHREVNLGHRLIFRRGLEIFGRVKTEIARDQIGRKGLDSGVKREHHVVVRLARERDLILGGGQFFLQAQHVLVGFQLRVIFHYREQPSDPRTELILGGDA